MEVVVHHAHLLSIAIMIAIFFTSARIVGTTRGQSYCPGLPLLNVNRVEYCSMENCPISRQPNRFTVPSYVQGRTIRSRFLFNYYRELSV